MTPIEQELKRLAELEKAATPGPWEGTHYGDEVEITAPGAKLSEFYIYLETTRAKNITPATVEFIAELRNAAPGLIEALSLAVEALEQEHDHLPTDGGATYGNCRACIAISQISKALLKGGE